ncbi:MAG: hypothetical protein K6G68_03950 [Oscillospiraceae bacterium]|jgi:hypothetical protein|nr:hypothetical protein [Oscillospiraceae bacterium]
MNNRMFTLDLLVEPGEYSEAPGWQEEQDTVTEEQTRTEDVGAGAGETAVAQRLNENVPAENAPFLAVLGVSAAVIAVAVALSVRKIAAKAALPAEDK